MSVSPPPSHPSPPPAPPSARVSDRDPWLSAIRDDWPTDPLLPFELAVELLFDQWDSLQIARQYHLYGRSTDFDSLVEEFVTNTIEWVEDNDGAIPIDEVAEFLDDTLQRHFHCQTEEQSVDEVARKIMGIYGDCVKRKAYGGVVKMLNESEKVKATMRDTLKLNEVKGDDEEGEDDEDGESGGEDEGDEDAKVNSVEEKVKDLAVNPSSSSSSASTPEEDEWTTVSSKKKGKAKGKDKK